MRNNRILSSLRISLENESDDKVINDPTEGVSAGDDNLKVHHIEGEQGKVTHVDDKVTKANTDDSVVLPKDGGLEDEVADAPDTVKASAEEYEPTDLEEVDEIEIDGETETIIPEDITETYEEGEVASDDNEDIAVIQDSLENYHALLTTAIKQRGYLHPETMAAVQIGLEQIDPMCFRNVNLGLERYNAKTKEQISLEFLDSVKERVTSAGKTAYNALLELIDKLANLFTSLLTDAAGLEKKIAGIKNSLNGVKSKQIDAPLKVSNANMLMVENRTVFEDIDSLVDMLTVIDVLATRFPESVVKGLATIQRAKEDANIEDLYDKATADFMQDIADRHMDKVDEYPEAIGDSYRAYRSDVLPGGYALYLNQENSEAGDVKFHFERAESYESADIKVPTPVELIKVLDVCAKVTRAIGEVRSTNSAYNRTKSGLREASKLEGNRKDAMDKFIKTIRSGMVSTHQFFGYILRVVKAIIAASSVAVKQLTTVDETEGSAAAA